MEQPVPIVYGLAREALILQHTTTHTMNIQRTLALFAIPMLLVACSSENGGAGEEMAPANNELATEKAAPEAKMDPAADAAEAPVETGPTTSMTFAENAWDFGTIDEGDAVTHIFKFTNTGDTPLVIDRCKGSCGCTVPQCPKEPIAPGEIGEIEVKFNSKGKKNKQTKTVTINANTVPEQTRITISANVTPAPATDGAGK
jgi:hypothetical protein